MFWIATRALAAAVAASVLIGAWMYNQSSATQAADSGACWPERPPRRHWS